MLQTSRGKFVFILFILWLDRLILHCKDICSIFLMLYSIHRMWPGSHWRPTWGRVHTNGVSANAADTPKYSSRERIIKPYKEAMHTEQRDGVSVNLHCAVPRGCMKFADSQWDFAVNSIQCNFKMQPRTHRRRRNNEPSRIPRRSLSTTRRATPTRPH